MKNQMSRKSHKIKWATLNEPDIFCVQQFNSQYILSLILSVYWVEYFHFWIIVSNLNNFLLLVCAIIPLLFLQWIDSRKAGQNKSVAPVFQTCFQTSHSEKKPCEWGCSVSINIFFSFSLEVPKYQYHHNKQRNEVVMKAAL